MPFYPANPAGSFTASPELERPEEIEARPDLSETFGAAFRQGNTGVSWVTSRDLGFAERPFNPDHDPWAKIEGTPYEAYAEQFAHSRDDEHFEAIKADIDRENRDRDILSRAGTVSSLTAQLAAGGLDWPTLLPGGQIVRTAKGGVNILKSAASTAAYGAAGAALQEGALQATQKTRTLAESAGMVGGATVLSGLLGAGVAKYVARGDIPRLSRKIERDMDVPPVGKPDYFEPGGLGAVERRADAVFTDTTARARALDDAGNEIGFVSGTVKGNTLTIDKSTLPAIHQGQGYGVAMYRAIVDEAIERGLRVESSFEVSEKASRVYDALARRGYNVERLPFRIEDASGGRRIVVTDNLTRRPIAITGRTLPEIIEEAAKTHVGRTTLGTGGVPTSAGAMAVTRAKDTLKSAFGMERVFARRVPSFLQDPMLHLQTSESAISNRHVQELAETPLVYDKNALGEVTAPAGSEMGAPGSVETRVRFWNAPLAEATQVLDNAFLRYRRVEAERFIGLRKSAVTLGDAVRGTQRMTYRQFKEEVARALRRGDASDIPEAAEVAQHMRKTIFDPLKDEAIRLGLLPEDVTPETAQSYLNRLYNHKRITAERDQFKAVIVGWLQAQEAINVRVRSALGPLIKRHDDLTSTIERLEGVKGQSAELPKSLAKAKADLDEVRGQIEEQIAAYRGKSSREATSAVRERDAREAVRTDEQRARKARLTSADKAVIDTARRIAQQLDKEPGEVGALADEIIDRILGTPEGRLPYNAHSNTTTFNGVNVEARGPLAARQFMIPDELIEQWLENDVELLMRAYVRTMAPDIELVKRFGRVDMQDQLKEIVEDYARLSSRATTAKERARLEKQKNRDIRDLAAIRDRLRGTFALPENPDGIMVRTGRVIHALNFVRLLGGATISAITDPGSIVLSHGFMNVVGDGFVPMVRNWSRFRLAADELKAAGTALDMVLNSRAMRIGDVMDDFGRHTKFERAVSSASANFGVLSLLSPWTASMKQFAGLVTMRRILRDVEALAVGKASRKVTERLAAGYISEAHARKIAEQFAKHGSKQDGVWLPNTVAWDADARPAIEAFRAALSREVDKIIITPGQDKPLWMSTEWGKHLGQFKSFAFAATQRLLVAGLQQRDAAVVQGVVTMIALGGLVEVLKLKASGREVDIDLTDPKKAAQFMANAVDRSGLLGWLMEANNMTEKLTRGAVGLSAITGKPISRYASRNITGALLGPTFGTVEDFIRVTGAATSREWNQSDSRVMRRLIPYNSIFWLRTIFDQAEAGINEFFGVPEPARGGRK